jgi:hypothetical protein
MAMSKRAQHTKKWNRSSRLFEAIRVIGGDPIDGPCEMHVVGTSGMPGSAGKTAGPRTAAIRRLARLLGAGLLLWPTLGGATEPERGDIWSGHHLALGASLRARYENKNDFAFGTSVAANDQDYFLTRLRLNLTWEPVESLSFFIEAQDAQIHSEQSTAIDSNATPNIFEDHLDVHRLFVQLDRRVAAIPVSLNVGRQKFNLGAQRLVASLEWVNTARVHDAVALTLGSEDERILLGFASWLVPVRPNDFNDHGNSANRYMDSQFHGLYYTDRKLVPNLELEGYFLIRVRDEADDEIYTVGSRLDWRRGIFDANAEVAGQFGEFGDRDHEAWMLHAGVGMVWGWAGRTHFSVAYNYASGDSNPTDGTHQTFDNLYPLNHAYYGYMDFVSLQNIHNLELVAKKTFFDVLKLRIAYQGFWLDEPESDSWYNAGMNAMRTAGGSASRELGHEIDVTLAFSVLEGHASIVVGYGHFFTGEYLSDTGSDSDADFLFVQPTIQY